MVQQTFFSSNNSSTARHSTT